MTVICCTLFFMHNIYLPFLYLGEFPFICMFIGFVSCCSYWQGSLIFLDWSDLCIQQDKFGLYFLPRFCTLTWVYWEKFAGQESSFIEERGYSLSIFFPSHTHCGADWVNNENIWEGKEKRKAIQKLVRYVIKLDNLKTCPNGRALSFWGLLIFLCLMLVLRSSQRSCLESIFNYLLYLIIASALELVL